MRDSFHFLEKLKGIGSLQENFLMFTIDVVGLYPSIPHEDGLSSLSEFLKNNFPHVVRKGICDFAELVLET